MKNKDQKQKTTIGREIMKDFHFSFFIFHFSLISEKSHVC